MNAPREKIIELKTCEGCGKQMQLWEDGRNSGSVRGFECDSCKKFVHLSANDVRADDPVVMPEMGEHVGG